MINRRRFILAGGAAVAGCGVIPEVNNPIPLYTLSPVRDFGRSLPKVNWQLVIGTPVASADLNTTRIALTRSPGVIEYYANGAWADYAPVLLQGKLIESFEASKAIVAVGRDAVGLRPDYVLQSELRDFQAEYSEGKPTAHLRLAAKLVRMPDRRIVANILTEQKVPAEGTSLAQIVRAFDRAAGEAFEDVVVRVLTAET
ncbi:ABC-type transport auxiliary lipoprotein family protein [Dongia deserti]|uniref:ABC-type transport auxiliary lipoprotein family protein n=1 Tax=Dongia deserti TaxID=2268030 RepID=UPI000E64926D|nr:ABC-type transport auxiliary lipoprotein family protein [Dongia deserti]